MEREGFSLYIGFAYLSLAVASLFYELSNVLINSLSLGALLFSASHFLLVLNERKVKKVSCLKVLKEKCDGANLEMQLLFQMQEEKLSLHKAHRSVLYFITLLLKAVAFSVILVYPACPQTAIVENPKIGVFCTILSLALLFFSFYYDHWKDVNKQIEDEKDTFECINKIIDSIASATKECEKKFDSLGSIIKGTDNRLDKIEKSIGDIDNIEQKRD